MGASEGTRRVQCCRESLVQWCWTRRREEKNRTRLVELKAVSGVRACLQGSPENYKTGRIFLPLPLCGTDEAFTAILRILRRSGGLDLRARFVGTVLGGR